MHSGHPSFVGMVPTSDRLVCWIVTNEFGTRAYTANNASGTLSIYDLSNPGRPVEMAAVELKGHGHPCQLALSSGEHWLYIVRRRPFDATMIGDGGVLNVLKIMPDGTAQEFGWPPVAAVLIEYSPAHHQEVAAV